MLKKRVVISGMGIMTPLGDNLKDFYNNLLLGRSGITNISSIDTSSIDCKVGGDLGDYDFKARISELKVKMPEDAFKRMRKILRTAPFATKLTLLTAVSAFIDAGLFDGEFDRDRFGGFLGGNNMNENYGVENTVRFLEDPDYIKPLLGLVFFDTDIIASISETLQFYGPMNTTAASCASAGIALRDAFNMIQLDEIDAAIAGGAVLDYSSMGLHSMAMLGAICPPEKSEIPEKASRPFDRDRSGFVFSHGSGMLIVEEYEHAVARGARIYAEILAVDSNNDANHLSNPSNAGQVKVIRKSLAKAGVRPDQIDFVSAHATSTPIGDFTEAETLKEVFGEHAKKLKINAPKSMLGHTGFAAHATELIAGILQMRGGKLHQSINVDNQDPKIDLDVCGSGPVEMQVNYFLNNSFGIGGINCCSVVKMI